MTGPSPVVAATVEAALAGSLTSWLIRGGWVDEREDGPVAEALRDNMEVAIAAALAETRPAEPEQDDLALLTRTVRPWTLCDDGNGFDHGSERAARAVLAAGFTRAPQPEQHDRLTDAEREELHGHVVGCDTAGLIDTVGAILAARRAPQPERAARDHGLRERVEVEWAAMSPEGTPWVLSEYRARQECEPPSRWRLVRRTRAVCADRVTAWEPVLADDAADTDGEAGQ